VGVELGCRELRKLMRAYSSIRVTDRTDRQSCGGQTDRQTGWTDRQTEQTEGVGTLVSTRNFS
jgi:hypothetical protein